MPGHLALIRGNESHIGDYNLILFVLFFVVWIVVTVSVTRQSPNYDYDFDDDDDDGDSDGDDDVEDKVMQNNHMCMNSFVPFCVHILTILQTKVPDIQMISESLRLFYP